MTLLWPKILMLVDQTLYPTLANPKPTGKLYHIPRVNPMMLKFQIEESMINLLSDTSLSHRPIDTDVSLTTRPVKNVELGFRRRI